MSKFTKGLVALAAVALVLAVAVSPAPASAQTSAELQALIASLQAQIAALTAQLGGGASAPASTSFTRDLTVGSVGADVMALQKLLNSKGFTIATAGAGSPGAESSYFGAKTKAALAAFQAANGITPASGYFGPKTRAAVSTMGGPVVTPGPGPVVIPGQGTEGLITTTLAGDPPNDANIRKATDVPVYGIEVKAVGSDMTVDRVDLQISVTPAGGSAQNPSTFFTGISAWDGSTKLMEKALSSSDFNKDSSNRYHIIVSGIGFKVAKDSTKTVVFKMNVASISSTDSARTVTIQGYAGSSQNIRAVDTKGLNSYTDMSGSSNTRTHTFNSPGTSTLTTSVNNQLTPKSQSNKVSTTDGVQKLTMQVFDVKSTTGASKITDVGVNVNATSSASAALPSTLFLYDGSTLLGSVTAPTAAGTTATFTNLKIDVAQDQTKSLTVKATFPTSVTNGLAASTSIASAGNILYDKPDGSSGNGGPSSAIAGKDQYFFAAAPQWTLVSANIATVASSATASSSLTGTIVLKAKADGGSMTKPTSSDFTVLFASSTQSNTSNYSAANSITVTNTAVTASPTDSTVGDGGEYVVTITGTIYSNNSSFGSSQNLFMAIKDIDAVVGNTTFTNQTWGVDTFFTAPAQLAKTTY